MKIKNINQINLIKLEGVMKKETDVIFHIRKPLKKQRGNQYYHDYSDRGQGNYCGSPETLFDVPHKSEARSWSSLQTHYVPCKQCCRIRAFGENWRVL